MVYKKKCPKCGKKFESLYESQLEYNFNAHLISCNKRGLYKTDIENIMKNALEKEKIDFVFQYPIRCKYGYITDFAIPNIKLIIETDGEIWHDKERDRKRDGYLKKQGWIILRFKGKKIKENISYCITKIKENIERRKNYENKS